MVARLVFKPALGRTAAAAMVAAARKRTNLIMMANIKTGFSVLMRLVVDVLVDVLVEGNSKLVWR